MSSKILLNRKINTNSCEDHGLLTVTPKKRKLSTDRRKWSQEEAKSILEYARNLFLNGLEFEKPSAPEYYEKCLTSINVESLKGVSTEKVVQFMKTQRNKYAKAIEWRNKTGEVVRLLDGESAVTDELVKRCPYFFQLDEILGTKPQYNPPFIYHSSLGKEDGTILNEFQDYEDIPVNLFLNESSVDANVEAMTNSSSETNALLDETPKSITQKNANSPSKIKKSKKFLKSPVRSAASSLEAALTNRTKADANRLAWEKECQLEDMKVRKINFDAELDFKGKQLAFERERWEQERIDKNVATQRTHELEKLKLEKESELQKLKIEKEYELSCLKLGLNPSN